MMWIIPTMRLPQQNETVLFVDSGGSYHLGYLNRKNKWYAYDFDGRIEKVAAWMPLPLWRSDMTDFIVRAENKGLECVGEVIRCKDCKHYEADIMGNPWGVCCHQDWVIGNCGSHVDGNGWCYRAERREENE